MILIGGATMNDQWIKTYRPRAVSRAVIVGTTFRLNSRFYLGVGMISRPWIKEPGTGKWAYCGWVTRCFAFNDYHLRVLWFTVALRVLKRI